MAVTRNGILYRDAPAGTSGGFAVQGGRTYSCAVDAYAPNASTGPNVIIQSTGFRWGDYYRWPLCRSPAEVDPGSFIHNIQCRLIGPSNKMGPGGKRWGMTFDFGPYDVNHEGGNNGDPSAPFDGKLNPFDVPIEVSWSGRAIEKSYAVDFSPTPQAFINNAGDPLEDPPKSEDNNPVLTLVRNEPQYDPLIVKNYRNRVNDAPWLPHGDLIPLLGGTPFPGFPTHSVKINEISAKRVYDADWGVYWTVTYEFEFCYDVDETGAFLGWKARVLNAGTRQLNTSGELKPCLVGGHEVSSPVALALDGSFDANSPPVPNYITFQRFRTVNFDGLNIPVTIFDSGLGT